MWRDDRLAAQMLFVIASLLPSSALAQPATSLSKDLSKDARRDFIRRAQVWIPTNVAAMNLRAGPEGRGSFQPEELVVCDRVERPMPGSSPKFYCAITGKGKDVVKVRYGDQNGEVIGSVLATRLLWALGFPADRVYPVRVRCRGCPRDPWNHREPTDDVHDFDLAVIERPPPGKEMKSASGKSGWAWPELETVSPTDGGARLEQRDALKLLAAFMQHSDTKPEQQRLLCAPGGLVGPGACEKPFLLLHDVGITFGHANWLNRDKTGSVNLEQWARTPVWRDADACVAHLGKSQTGTLEDPRISEAGRRFLGALLQQLTDRQLRDLFEVARVERRSGRVDEWIAAFKQKRDEILRTRCPN